MIKRSLCLLALMACGRTGVESKGPPVVDPSAVPCPELVRQPFHELAQVTDSAARVTCDGLVWRDAAHTLRISLAGQDPSMLGEHADRLIVSPSGRLVAWFDGTDYHLHAVIAGSEHLGLFGANEIFFLVAPDGTERLVGAWLNGGFTSMDETGVTRLLKAPDGAVWHWVPQHGDAVLVATASSLFAVSGSGEPTVELHVAVSVQNDAVTLSPDGQLLIHEPRTFTPCGDTFCGTPGGSTRILSTLTGLELASSLELRRSDTLLAGSDIRFAADDGHAFATEDSGGVLVVDSLFKVHHFAGQGLVAPPNGNRVVTLPLLTFAEMPLVVNDLLTGAHRDLFLSSESVLVSNDGLQAASSNISTTCIWHPDHRACREQLWDVMGGTTVTTGATWSLQALQPVEPQWLSSDGDLLVYGSLLSAPAPEAAADDVLEPWQVWLIGADGTRTALGTEAPVSIGTAFHRPVIATRLSLDVVSLTSHTRTTLATVNGNIRLLLNERSSFIAAAGQAQMGETLWAGTVVDP